MKYPCFIWTEVGQGEGRGKGTMAIMTGQDTPGYLLWISTVLIRLHHMQNHDYELLGANCKFTKAGWHETGTAVQNSGIPVSGILGGANEVLPHK